MKNSLAKTPRFKVSLEGDKIMAIPKSSSKENSESKQAEHHESAPTAEVEKPKAMRTMLLDDFNGGVAKIKQVVSALKQDLSKKDLAMELEAAIGILEA